MKRQLAVACLLILACAPPSAARQSDDKDKSEPAAPKQAEDESKRERPRVFKLAPGGESLPPELMDAFKPAELPEGKDSWALQIITRGGLAGGGRGDVVVTSDGRVSCSQQAAPCAVKPPGAALASLSRLVAAARPSKWKSSAGAACRDCYVTLFVLQRRAGDGQAKTHMLHWDDTTAAAVPADVKEMLRAVAGLTFVPARAL